MAKCRRPYCKNEPKEVNPRTGKVYTACAKCRKEAREYRNIQVRRAAGKRAWDKRSRILRGKLFSMYGNACKCCGETQEEFLTIDHINNDGKEHRETTPNTFKRWEEMLATYRPDLYQTLCMNCNWGKQQFGVCPHKKGL